MARLTISVDLLAWLLGITSLLQLITLYFLLRSLELAGGSAILPI